MLALKLNDSKYFGKIAECDDEGFELGSDGERRIDTATGMPVRSSNIAVSKGLCKLGEISSTFACDSECVIGEPMTFDERRESRIGYKGWSLLRRDDAKAAATRIAFLDRENRLQLYQVVKWRSPDKEFLVWIKNYERILGDARSSKFEDDHSQSYVSFDWQWPIYFYQHTPSDDSSVSLSITYCAGLTRLSGKSRSRHEARTILQLTHLVNHESFPAGIFDRLSSFYGLPQH